MACCVVYRLVTCSAAQVFAAASGYRFCHCYCPSRLYLPGLPTPNPEGSFRATHAEIPATRQSLKLLTPPAHLYTWHYTNSMYCYVTSVVSDSVWPHRGQPNRLPRPWDPPGKNTRVGCHFLLQCVKAKSESEVSDLATPWTAAYQAPPSIGFSRQEYWSGLPLSSPVPCIMSF